MKYFLIITLGISFVTAQIPLPEHPRPDFKRPQWINLNGRLFTEKILDVIHLTLH